MEHVELVFLIEMACKTKTTLTRVARERIKKENVQRTREARGKIEQKASRKNRDDTEKRVDSEKSGERKEKGVVKGVRRGLKALKEIKRYQSSTDMLIRRLPF